MFVHTSRDLRNLFGIKISRHSAELRALPHIICLTRTWCVASVRLSASAAASARSVFAAPARSTSSAALNSDNVFDSVEFCGQMLLLISGEASLARVRCGGKARARAHLLAAASAALHATDLALQPACFTNIQITKWINSHTPKCNCSTRNH
ncbi:PREDICTED: uncharacterized protein LOC106099841 isoform X2 [Papilio polytes]|uniref:uncharacterized protein LOC106099841 isoform X2 n=1 Tax=Papilio polytes TaxID=76194 RepID=UPI00067622B4|nr:PREDICTED: uncharacterized protein LOC106099841 isoform X2 [Papilio polytes]